MGMDLPMVIYAPAGLNMMQVRLQKLGFSVWMEIEDWFTGFTWPQRCQCRFSPPTMSGC